jgi:hypothetical protein
VNEPLVFENEPIVEGCMFERPPSPFSTVKYIQIRPAGARLPVQAIRPPELPYPPGRPYFHGHQDFTENKTVTVDRLDEDKVHLLGQSENGDGDGRRAYNIIAEATCIDKDRGVMSSGNVLWKERMGVGWLLGPNDEIADLLEDVLDWDCIVELLKYGAALEAQVLREPGISLNQNPLAHMDIAGSGPTFEKMDPPS